VCVCCVVCARARDSVCVCVCVCMCTNMNITNMIDAPMAMDVVVAVTFGEWQQQQQCHAVDGWWEATNSQRAPLEPKVRRRG
jgi:1,4-alpha-glucan branching enzyme